MADAVEHGRDSNVGLFAVSASRFSIIVADHIDPAFLLFQVASRNKSVHRAGCWWCGL
jgi:hypothetical protein